MKHDPLHKPVDAAPLLLIPVKAVRHLCATGLIRCEVERSPGGRVRYFIPESAIADYRQRRTQRRAVA